jgi:nucleotide-binding universal stress UspA family protein
VQVEPVLVEDYPEEATASFSKRFSCDLMVVGTQGAHELVEGGLGSVATAMLRTSDVPVLVIPDGAMDRDPSHIVYAVDFHDHDRETLRFLQYLAARLDSRLTVLHIREHAVFDQADEYQNFQQTFHDLMEDDRCAFDLVRGVDLAETLRDYLENREADWLVMRSRHRNEEEWDSESLTREMAWHARSPLMVFPA